LKTHRTFDVAKEYYPPDRLVVLDVVNVGFIEEHFLSVAPTVLLAVDVDEASGVTGSDKPEVITD
jgi:hypothetical protein